jgi:hypothetical protein
LNENARAPSLDSTPGATLAGGSRSSSITLSGVASSAISPTARDALPRLGRLADRGGSEHDRVCLAWLEARITSAEGDLARAAEIYRPVLARCLELDTIYDSAMVALELAVVLLELGSADEVLPLADTVAPIFKAQGVEPEAAAAVLLAAESLRRGVAAREVLLTLLAARAGARRGR